MAEGESAPSLLHPDAGQWNRDLLVEFHKLLERNPAADLLSVFSDQYRRAHQLVQFPQLSRAGKLNQRTLNELYIRFQLDPEINILSEIPKDYNRRITSATKSKLVAEQTLVQQPDFRQKLDKVETAIVVFPLSDTVTNLLVNCGSFSVTDMEEQSLVSTLKQLLWKSTKLWEFPVRGVVLQCSNEIVAKVVTGNSNYTEYTTMEYLAEKLPDIPAPRPHGLIAFGPFRVIFMSYIAGMTLTSAWPSLSEHQKLSVREQLDNIFSRLRTLGIEDGQTLGGVCGEGVKELRINEITTFKDITSTAQYSDLQFSAKHHGSDTYVKFLRSFLNEDSSRPTNNTVFTHGDVRTDNIMVELRPDHDDIAINAIIDWEDSGFYPDYYECEALTRTLSVVDENDWYLHLPDCISPLNFPQRWLVDRLWGIHLRTT